MTFRWRLIGLFLVIAICLAWGGHADGQNGAAGESVTLTTQDGVQLKISYFAGDARKGSLQAKQTTPVVFLHDYKGSRAAFTPLVQKLQATSKGEGDKPSFAAVTVDLRAHGESTKQVFNGSQIDLDPAKLNKDDLLAMSHFDLDAVRSFLVDKNDAGELNLNKLAIVGSGMGASVAANWALTDWSYPPLPVVKQGQDVKAIVMISPRWNFNGLTMQGPMQFRALKEKVAWMLMCGDKDPKYKSDLVRIQKQIERFHPKTDETGAARRNGFTVVELPAKLQGDSLLTQVAGADDQIVKFLVDNLANAQPPWIERRKPLP
jgi:pimeloyl-ACP methyl ester carboxylesterase